MGQLLLISYFCHIMTEEIRLGYKSKYNLNRKNQVILLIITDGKKQHYLAVKSLLALLKAHKIIKKHLNYIIN